MQRRDFLQLGLMGLLAAPGHAQFGQLKLPKPPGVKLPEFNGEQFIKRTPPLTTNLADVYEAVPGFNDWLPEDAISLTVVPRNAEGDYLVLPGLYELVAESFCLKAGTNPPGREAGNYGQGYLYAPLKGPKARQIEQILRRSEDHPEVPQFEIQLLLWAIIAESKLSECPKNLQNTARILLDERDRRALENDVLGIVPAPLRGKVYGNLPPLVREALEAENKMRELLARKFAEVEQPAEELVDSANTPGKKVSALYAQLEALAMRTGALPEVPEKEQVPRGQWSWHPDGFFLRLLPHGYALTTRQLYFPETFQLRGRELIAPDGVAHTIPGTLPVRNDSATLQRLFAQTDSRTENQALRSALARAALSALAQAKHPLRTKTCSIYGSGFGGAGGGGAGMGAPGSQRLGQSRKPAENPTLERTRKATKALSLYADKVAKVPSPPLKMVDALIGWQLDMTSAIDRALNGESTASVPLPGGGEEATCGSTTQQTLPRPRQVRLGAEPETLTQARQVFSDALATLCEAGQARLRAEQSFTQERSAPNGYALVATRRTWGIAQQGVARAGKALLAAYRAAEGEDADWDEAEWRAYHTRILSQGFTDEERAAARTVGLTESQLVASLARKRRLTEHDYPSGGFVEGLDALCPLLEEASRDYANLPQNP